MDKNNIKSILLKCENWLRTNKFDYFTVLKIFVGYDRKEIMVVVDKINDDVLEEFYDKTFDFTYKCDDEIVFIITEENSITLNGMVCGRSGDKYK